MTRGWWWWLCCAGIAIATFALPKQFVQPSTAAALGVLFVVDIAMNIWFIREMRATRALFQCGLDATNRVRDLIRKTPPNQTPREP